MIGSAAWSTLLAVLRKELRDIARDRRTLAMALLLFPLLYPVLMLGMGALAESRARTQLERVLEVPVRGAGRAPNLVAYLATHNIRAVAAPADLEAAIARQDVDVALVVGADYPSAWREGRAAPVEIVADSTRRAAEIPTRRLRAALEAYRDQVGSLRLLVRGVDPAVTRALSIGTRDLASAEARRGVLAAALLPYLLILTAFVGGSHLILDATAGERERQSLEPLLATPAARGAIVSGKIAAACVMGLASLLLTLLAFKLSARFAGTGQAIDVGLAAVGRMLLVLLPMLFMGTALLTWLAAAARSMKEAQGHLMWLMLLPMVPSVALMVSPLREQPWQYAVPFLAQNQMLLKIIRGEPIALSIWALYLAAGAGLAAGLWLAAVRRYRNERLAISA